MAFQSSKGSADGRPSWDEYFLDMADAVSKRATCDRGKSGCVIALDKRLLVAGYVGSPSGFHHCGEVGHPTLLRCRRHAASSAVPSVSS